MNNQTAYLKISGLVQGIGLRHASARYARQHNLKGWIRNEDDGTVSCCLQNEPEQIQTYAEWLKIQFMGLVAKIELEWRIAQEKYKDFKIIFK